MKKFLINVKYGFYLTIFITFSVGLYGGFNDRHDVWYRVCLDFIKLYLGWAYLSWDILLFGAIIFGLIITAIRALFVKFIRKE